MNLKEILQQIQVQLGNGADEIDWEDDETLARITLANSGILTWATAQNTSWAELQKNIYLGEIQTGKNEFELPKEIHKIEKIFIHDKIKFEFEITTLSRAMRDGRGFYIEGNAKTGRKLKLAQIITSDDILAGKNISIVGIKAPDPLKNADDVPEMSDPTFIVDYVCAMVSTDDDLNKYTIFSTNYAQKLNDMVALSNSYDNYDLMEDCDLVIGE